MADWTVWIVLTAETLVAGGIFLLIPKITRRGLLFGVYVGEDRWAGPEARRITRVWYLALLAALIASILVGTILALTAPKRPLGALSSLFLLLVAMIVTYLWAHFRARSLATTGRPVAAAALVVESPQALTIPILATAFAALAGAVAIGYAWFHFADMPDTIPTHFGPDGTPDAWSPRSFRSVLLLPVMTAFICPALGLMACLVARAKRAIRQDDRGVSLSAQVRFRRAVSIFLSGIVVIVTVLLASISISSVRVALGLATALPRITMAMGLGLGVFAFVGVLVLMLYYGQGGARLERSTAGAPLTDGLADNTHWVLGVFYVNREDPSFLVEKRFGMGYTVNFGNPKAILGVLIFFAVLIGVMLVAGSVPQTHVPPG
jgi:uncharacterized membrane protein